MNDCNPITMEDHHRLYPCINMSKWWKAGEYMVKNNANGAMASSYDHKEMDYSHLYALLKIDGIVRAVVAVSPPGIRNGTHETMLNYIRSHPENWVSDMVFPLPDVEKIADIHIGDTVKIRNDQNSVLWTVEGFDKDGRVNIVHDQGWMVTHYCTDRSNIEILK